MTAFTKPPSSFFRPHIIQQQRSTLHRATNKKRQVPKGTISIQTTQFSCNYPTALRVTESDDFYQSCDTATHLSAPSTPSTIYRALRLSRLRGFERPPSPPTESLGTIVEVRTIFLSVPPTSSCVVGLHAPLPPSLTCKLNSALPRRVSHIHHCTPCAPRRRPSCLSPIRCSNYDGKISPSLIDLYSCICSAPQAFSFLNLLCLAKKSFPASPFHSGTFSPASQQSNTKLSQLSHLHIQGI